MQIHLAPEFQGTPKGAEVEAIVRNCVHCGFCNATCPTYQLLGDELDGPRGRIYLIKQVLEGAPVSTATQQHLDRCLTCRNCESTCPSGVRYGNLLEIGREVVDAKVPRPAAARAMRWLLKEGLTSRLFGPAMRLGQAARPLLPRVLKAKVPQTVPTQMRGWPTGTHARKVLLLAGCVQPAMAPNINQATARVLDAAGIQTLVPPAAGCCGAIRTHLSDVVGGLSDMRRNIDAWWPLIDQAEAIVTNASGCGVTVKSYGHALAHEPTYADKARVISDKTLDLSELLPELVTALRPQLKMRHWRNLAFHSPCTLQHGQQLRGGVEIHMGEMGFKLAAPSAESHLCCGSAGTYSVLQTELAVKLRDRKIRHLEATHPEAIISANLGCISHLQSGTDLPVRHWVEVLDEALWGGVPVPVTERQRQGSVA